MRHPMTLGQIIDTLKRKEPTEEVRFDFVYFRPTTLRSWRGDYSQLSLGYAHDSPKTTTVAELLAECEAAVGKTFQGWKGGDYTMNERTRVYVGNSGEGAGTAIVDIIDGTYLVLVTEYVDP